MVTVFAALAAADIDRLDAEVLLSHVLGFERISLFSNSGAPVSGEDLSEFERLVKRRRAGEPVAYLIGEREFMSLRFKVGKDVLIPRPETELLAETGISLARERDGASVLDICTGSGCVAVSVAFYAGGARVSGVDISEGAVEIARENAAANGVSARAKFWQKDILKGKIEQNYDIILANPPYIKTGDLQGLDNGVKKYEPKIALDGGDDGLLFYRGIIPRAACSLNFGGALALEIDFRLGGAVADIMEENGFEDIEIKKDLAGLDRVVLGRAR